MWLTALSFVIIFLVAILVPDIIAAYRGVRLKTKLDFHGDEVGFIGLVLAYPWRLWESLTLIPINEVRGVHAVTALARRKWSQNPPRVIEMEQGKQIAAADLPERIKEAPFGYRALNELWSVHAYVAVVLLFLLACLFLLFFSASFSSFHIAISIGLAFIVLALAIQYLLRLYSALKLISAAVSDTRPIPALVSVEWSRPGSFEYVIAGKGLPAEATGKRWKVGYWQTHVAAIGSPFVDKEETELQIHLGTLPVYFDAKSGRPLALMFYSKGFQQWLLLAVI